MPRRPALLLPAVLAAALLPSVPAHAFAIFPQDVQLAPCGGASCPVDVEQSLRAARRWDASPGGPATLADGIQVGIDPGFAEFIVGGTLTVPLTFAEVEQGVLDAFSAWETRDLGFEIVFDQAVAAEIQVHVVDGRTHPYFRGNGFSGLALVYAYASPLTLTSGALIYGTVIEAAEIVIAADRLWQGFNLWVLAGLLDPEDRLERFVNLMIHEIGHTLGLHHANEFPQLNFDDDGNPFSVVHPANPLAPWEGMSISGNVDPNAIMRGGLPVDFDSFRATELYADDRSGRNVLYPSVPEPTALVLLLLAGAWGSRRA